MDLNLTTIHHVQLFSLIFFRSIGFFIRVPIINAYVIPFRIKVLLAFILTIVLYPFLARNLDFQPVYNIYIYTFVLINQFIIGLVMALVLDIMVVLFQVLGQIFSFQMGLSIGEIIDPLQQAPSYTLSQLLAFLGFLIFFHIKGHIIIVEAFYASFFSVLFYINPHIEDFKNIFDLLFKTFSFMFKTAVQIGFPILGTISIIYITLGILAKLAPQINVFILGFPIYIASGLFLIMIYMPFLMDLSRGFINLFLKKIFQIW